MNLEQSDKREGKFKKIVNIESSEGHYEADACAITCIDDRFTSAVEATKKAEGWEHVDSVKWAGAAKALAAEDPRDVSSEGKGLLDQIAKSIKLHNTREIVISLHEGCGAYGEKMPHGHEAALSFMEKELLKASAVVSAFLAENGTERPVRLMAYSFEGVYEIPAEEIELAKAA